MVNATPSESAARLKGETDTLVVGGGVLGCAAAYHLARRGVDTILIDRDDLNSHASGTNAGSLHVQINSHFAKLSDPASVRGVDGTVPLLVAAVDSWRQLAGELDEDVELDVGGGLMLAETESQLAFLDTVAAREKRIGLQVEQVSGTALQSLAPYLSSRVIGANFCALEGKVNPIVATPAIARAAARAGATISARTSLGGLTREVAGFTARTSRGTIRCRNVINAAGAWAGEVGAMIGLHLPVEPRPLHMNVTEPVEYFLPHLIQHAGVKLTMKQASRGNVIIGGGWPGERDAETGRLGVLRTSIEGNLWTAQQVVPRLAEMLLLRTWGGLIYRVPDVSPVLGPTRVCPGFFVAVAVPNGYTLAPICGEIVADFVQGRRHPMYKDQYSPDRYGGEICPPADRQN